MPLKASGKTTHYTLLFFWCVMGAYLNILRGISPPTGTSGVFQPRVNEGRVGEELSCKTYYCLFWEETVSRPFDIWVA